MTSKRPLSVLVFGYIENTFRQRQRPCSVGINRDVRLDIARRRVSLIIGEDLQIDVGERIKKNCKEPYFRDARTNQLIVWIQLIASNDFKTTSSHGICMFGAGGAAPNRGKKCLTEMPASLASPILNTTSHSGTAGIQNVILYMYICIT